MLSRKRSMYFLPLIKTRDCADQNQIGFCQIGSGLGRLISAPPSSAHALRARLPEAGERVRVGAHDGSGIGIIDKSTGGFDVHARARVLRKDCRKNPKRDMLAVTESLLTFHQHIRAETMTAQSGSTHNYRTERRTIR